MKRSQGRYISRQQQFKFQPSPPPLEIVTLEDELDVETIPLIVSN